jgi:hypothetical protein
LESSRALSESLSFSKRATTNDSISGSSKKEKDEYDQLLDKLKNSADNSGDRKKKDMR